MITGVFVWAMKQSVLLISFRGDWESSVNYTIVNYGIVLLAGVNVNVSALLIRVETLSR